MQGRSTYVVELRLSLGRSNLERSRQLGSTDTERLILQNVPTKRACLTENKRPLRKSWREGE